MAHHQGRNGGRPLVHLPEIFDSDDEAELPQQQDGSDFAEAEIPQYYNPRHRFGGPPRLQEDFHIKMNIPFFDERLHIED